MASSSSSSAVYSPVATQDTDQNIAIAVPAYAVDDQIQQDVVYATTLAEYEAEKARTT
jgi:hypothetical protein